MRDIKRLGLWVCLTAVVTLSTQAGLLEEGRAAYQQGRYEEAYDLFSRAFRADPGSVEVNFELAEAANQRKKYSHAVFAYDRVLMAEPAHQKARYGKARALMALGQDGEAREEYTILLKSEMPSDLRVRVQEAIRQIDRQSRELKLRGEASVALFYDDNINFGPGDGTLVPGANRRDNAWGLEAGVGVSAEYDVGRKGGWTATGSASVLNSWHDSAPDQEARTIKFRAGARRLEQRDLYEISSRVEMVDYGHDRLVDLYGMDAAWLHAKTRDDYLITRLTVEHRDYDSKIDPDNDRDSVYLSGGHTWKHFFQNRRNTVSLGGELFREDARDDVNSNSGFRLLLDGERELPGEVIAYTGIRYRLSQYDDRVGINPEREDSRYDVILGARRRIAENCTLDFRHQYIRNDSNIGISDYDRHRTSLTAIFEF